MERTCVVYELLREVDDKRRIITNAGSRLAGEARMACSLEICDQEECVALRMKVPGGDGQQRGEEE